MMCVGMNVCTDASAVWPGISGSGKDDGYPRWRQPRLALTTTGPWRGRLLAEARSFLSWAFIWLWGSVTTAGRLAAAHPGLAGPPCPTPGCSEA